MKTLSLSEVKMKLSALVDRVEATDEEVVITRNGRPAAVLVSPDEYESWKETVALKSQAGFIDEIKNGLQQFKDGKTRLYTLEDLFEESSGHKLRMAEDLASLIRGMHPVLKKKVRASLKIILSDPTSGKALRDNLAGLRSFKIGRLRVVYRASKTAVQVVAIGPRSRIYEETARFVNRKGAATSRLRCSFQCVNGTVDTAQRMK